MRGYPHFLERIFPGTMEPLAKALRGGGDAGSGHYPGVDPIYLWLQNQLEIGYERSTKYQEYHAMDEQSPEISAALDYYGDDATQFDKEHKARIWVESESHPLESIGNEGLVRLQADSVAWGIARNTAKNGDDFWRLYLDYPEPGRPEGSRGVLGWVPNVAKYVRRLEDPRGRLLGFKKDAIGIGLNPNPGTLRDPRADPNRYFNPWDFIHFRIRQSASAEFSSMYGQSMLKAARSVYKRLKILEEMLVLYRLIRSPDRMVYYVDVTELSHERAIEAVREWKAYLKKNRYTNPISGEFQQSFNPHAFDEDIVWPIRKDTATRLDRLQGSVDVTSIADIEYYRDKMFLALMIPREYLSGQGSAVIQIGGGQSLAQKDIRYARTVSRLQRAIVEGFTRAIQIHYAMLSIDPSPERFQVMMAPISTLDDQQRLEAFSIKLGVASQFAALSQELGVDQLTARVYVFKELLGISAAYMDRFLAPPDYSMLQPQAPVQADQPTPPPAQLQAPAEALDRIRQVISEDGSGRERILNTVKRLRDSISVVEYGPVFDHSPLPNDSTWVRPTDEEFDALAENQLQR